MIKRELTPQCELCGRPVEVPEYCELHNRKTDVEKLEQAMELVTEVKDNHNYEVAVMGRLLEARRDIRQSRDYLERHDG